MKLDFRSMKAFCAAFPNLSQDFLFRAVLDNYGNFISAWLTTRSRLIFEEIPKQLWPSLLKRLAIMNEKSAVEFLLRAGADPKWLVYPLKRALRLGLEEQVNWMRSLLTNEEQKSIIVVKLNTSINSNDLFQAIEEESLDRVRQLINSGVDVNAHEEEEYFSICRAAIIGNIEILQALIDCGADINCTSIIANVLHCARNIDRLKLIKIVQILIDCGANIDAPDDCQWTPLIVAAREGIVEAAKELLFSGAQLQCQTSYGATALNRAAYDGNVECCELLLEAGAEMEIKDDTGNTALITAADGCIVPDDETDTNHMKIFLALIKAGANVNASNNNGVTVLMGASCLEKVKCLVEAGANVNAVSETGKTALKAHIYNHEIVEYLIRSGADIDYRGADGRTALMEAAEAGQTRTVYTLLQAGADMTIREDKYKETPLLRARRQNRSQVIKLLELKQRLLEESLTAEERERISEDMPKTCYPDSLIDAAASGNVDRVKELISCGVKVNYKGIYGTTALFEGIKHIQVVEALVKAGADVNFADGSFTILMKAVCEADPDVVKYLIDSGANVHSICVSSRSSFSATHFAATGNKPAELDLLIRAGADVTNETGIVEATDRGYTKIVQLLIQSGTDVNIRGDYNDTAIIIATSKNDLEIARMLLAAGADVHLTNFDGQSAVDFATSAEMQLLLR